MKRLVVLSLALVTLVASAACGARREQPGLPTDGIVIAQWREVGGFVRPSWSLIKAPGLVVYSDGLAVAGADRQLTLTEQETAQLLDDLRGDLNGLAPTVQPDGGPTVADAPTAVLDVWQTAGGLQSVRAEALGMQAGYPAGLVRAKERMEQLSERVTREGAPYTSNRVRLVIDKREGGKAASWPAAVPVPKQYPGDFGDIGVYYADLEGPAALAVVAQWPNSIAHADGAWPERTLPSGEVVGVAWRYLQRGE